MLTKALKCNDTYIVIASRVTLIKLPDAHLKFDCKVFAFECGFLFWIWQIFKILIFIWQPYFVAQRCKSRKVEFVLFRLCSTARRTTAQSLSSRLEPGENTRMPNTRTTWAETSPPSAAGPNGGQKIISTWEKHSQLTPTPPLSCVLIVNKSPPYQLQSEDHENNCSSATLHPKRE